ncbi:MAG TPA: hypothetical protein VFN11_19415 [Ktedonobacterales bacterium]|nr:hypothetical protein [Ktedonobacterales bacterium]
MSGTFSHLTRNHARLVHEFDDGETITIDYHPAMLTPRQLHRIQLLSDTPFKDLSTAEQIELMDRTQEMLASTLIDWDAKNDKGEKIPPTLDGLEDVHYDAQAAILQWIRDDQRAPKANGSEKLPESSTLPLALPDPAPMTTSSRHARNGTTPVRSRNGSA